MMNTRRTCSFIFLWISLAPWACAQNAPDSLAQAPPPRPRLSLDLAELATSLADSGHRQWEMAADLNLGPRYFATVELGRQDIRLDRTEYEYRLRGGYLRLGADRDLFPTHPDDHLLVGLRYGMAYFRHEAPSVRVDDGFWGGYQASMPERQLWLHWLELSLGMKTELFVPRLFLGWNASARLPLWGELDDQAQPASIPGFSRGERRISFGLNYWLSYRFGPLGRKTSG